MEPAKYYTIDVGPVDDGEYAFIAHQLRRRDFTSDPIRVGLNEHLNSQTFFRSYLRIELHILRSPRNKIASFATENNQAVEDLLMVIDAIEQPYLRPLCMCLPWARSFVADLLDPLPDGPINSEL